MAAKRRESFEKRIERLERENQQLREEGEHLREKLSLLPPESFLVAYCLLYEDAYLTRQPDPEVKVRQQKPGGGGSQIKNFRSHRMKQNVDKQLYRVKYQIVRYLENGEPIPDAGKQGKSQG